MWVKILLALLALSGFWLMWFSVFGKKKHIDELDGREGVSISFFELVFDLVLNLSPTLIKRILLFILGSVIAGISTIGVIYS
ncbi:hypothetical protein QTG56_00990 [Rossellomorea sp. AcN35-11]|nr:hypothetical protein [Rossellomorea aquimaris]WJV29778.1 hypothetical protein QTG56_00990 [Rossellomorea sp. AcN35-11]